MTEHERTDFDGRLSRLEAVTESIAKSVQSIAVKVDDVGKPNWSGLSVLLTALVAVGTMGAFAINGPIANNAENTRDVKDTLTRLLEREQDRNNRIESEMGEMRMIDRLFMNGKLKLD